MKYSKSGAMLQSTSPVTENQRLGKNVNGKTAAGCEKVKGIFVGLIYKRCRKIMAGNGQGLASVAIFVIVQPEPQRSKVMLLMLYYVARRYSPAGTADEQRTGR